MTANVTFTKYGRIVGNQAPPLAFMEGYVTEDIASGATTKQATTNDLQVVVIKAFGSDVRVQLGVAPVASGAAGIYLSDGEVRELVLPVGWKVSASDAE
jgi:hypothetical protein